MKDLEDYTKSEIADLADRFCVVQNKSTLQFTCIFDHESVPRFLKEFNKDHKIL
jgi:hypothetical protein